MRRTALLPLAAALLVACDATPLPLAPADRPSAAASTDRSITRTQLNLARYSSCTDEMIQLSGTWTEVVNVAQNGTGEWVLTRGTLSNLKGEGLSSGTHYVGAAVETGHRVLTRGADSYAYQLTSLLISQGGGPNLVVRLTSRITYGPDGQPVVEVVDFVTECQGAADGGAAQS